MYEKIARWMKRNYIPHQPHEMMIVQSKAACCNLNTLGHIGDGFEVGHGYTYAGYTMHDSSVVTPFIAFHDRRPARRTGGLLFHFVHTETETHVDVLLIAGWQHDAVLACVPEDFIEQWLNFEEECNRVQTSAMSYREKIYIIGGTETSFDTKMQWEEICLPPGLRENILEDVDAFFEKGVAIYNRLNLKPFRKLLMAGVPGTGKTMICSALARWALDKGYFVIYVSGSNAYGSQFWKIHQALDTAAKSDSPAIIIVEEIDAYLQGNSKAQMLNVLDGSETPMNLKGTLMLATTNHPEKIDDRVMKRPGRLDRVFIIPELTSEADAEKMLRRYLDDFWQDAHMAVVPELVGRPGAFVREVALHAMTSAAYAGHRDLPLDVLENSLDTLMKQIKAKDDFLTSHKQRPMGLAAATKNGKHK